MFAFLGVSRIIFIVEVEDKFFRFKAKLLIEQHSRVGGRDMESDIFPHTGLKQGHIKSLKVNHWSNRGSPAQFENQIKPRVYVRRITLSTMYKKAAFC